MRVRRRWHTDAGEATLATDVVGAGGATPAVDESAGELVVGTVDEVAGLFRVEPSRLSGELTEFGWSRTTPSGRTNGSLASANANPPSPTPTSVPLTAATFQLMRVFVM